MGSILEYSQLFSGLLISSVLFPILAPTCPFTQATCASLGSLWKTMTSYLGV
jgi:hypothetical protein